MRKKIVAGNWKMNLDFKEAESFIDEFLKLANEESIYRDSYEIIISPNFTQLPLLLEKTKDEEINISSQNVSKFEKGAYTGEVSAKMLSSLNVPYSIIGHSERREYFNETNEDLKEKLLRLKDEKLKVIFCCGESLDIREKGGEKDFVKSQLEDSLSGINFDNIEEELIIAYEPIWAIGTGKTATSVQAEEMCKFIREVLGNIFSAEDASKIRILYGGSVTPDNAKELFSMENIDGGLVGGASLVPEKFIGICKSA